MKSVDKTKSARKEIDLKVFKRRVIFWTTIAIVVAYALAFLFAFTQKAHADTALTYNVMECNVDEGRMMNRIYWKIDNKPTGAWEEATYFNWACSDPNQNLITVVFLTIANWMAIGTTIAVVAGIIYGAVLYITASGDSGKAKKAIGVIRSAVVALILYFAMYAIINFLIPGGAYRGLFS